MKKIFTLVAVLLAGLSMSAQQMPPIPVDPAVRIGHLDNGLTYYIRHHEEPKGQANFYIAQKVGSILEEESQRGLAHFLEHMCFNGTQHFSGNGVIQYCESIGVKFGANLNAYTSVDETVYNIDNVPVGTTPSAIDSCLWILHDWADGLLLTDEDIDHERGVIHEEWRSRSGAQMRMLEKSLPVMYPGNRYGERLPIGLMEVVDNFPYQVLRDYYEKWYRPDLQGIIVVGDIDVDEIEAKIKEIFSTIATPVDPAERYYVQVEDNAEPIICMITDKEQPYALSYVFCKHDAYPDNMKDNLGYLVYSYAKYAAQLMLNTRLQELEQSANPPFIQGIATDGEFFIAKTKDAFTGICASSETDILKSVTTVYRELLRAARGGFTASEYERARAEILSQYETAYNQRDKKKSSEFCSEYVRHFLDNEPIAGDENMYLLSQQLAPNIPVEAVNQIVASFVGEGTSNLVLQCMLPEKEGVTYPTADQMKDALAAVAAENIEPYVDEVSNEPLISELPAPGKVKKVKESKFGYRKYTLSNGATVYFKKTDFNADEIIMTAISEGGTSLYPVSESPVLRTLNELLSIGGVGNFSKTALSKALSGKQVSAVPVVGTNNESIIARGTPKDFETMLQLVYLNFTAPRQDDEAFTSWKTRSAAAIANRAKQPSSAFQDTLVTSVHSEPERALALSLEDLEKVDYNRAIEIAKERFANAADFSFIFTGNIDEQVAIPMFEQYIGSLPSIKGKKEKPLAKNPFKNGEINKLFDRQMEIPMVSNCFLYHGTAKADLKESIAFDVALNALTEVLLAEIREKEGGTYGIGAYGAMEAYPIKEAFVQIHYQTNPEKYEYLNQRVREIVADFVQNGPSEASLSKAKEYFIKNYKENLRENSYWSGVISDYILSGADNDTEYEAILNGLDSETVRKVFASIFNQNNHSEVIMHGVK
ncbi:MAG: insulinase family protein [Bacteroidales bacterium]|nr:insulinase family protein [Candidatus Cacconaster merdequi]